MATQEAETRVAMRHEDYNANCGIQYAAMELALDWLPTFPDGETRTAAATLRRTVSNEETPTAKSLTVVDYGCAQGANS